MDVFSAKVDPIELIYFAYEVKELENYHIYLYNLILPIDNIINGWTSADCDALSMHKAESHP